MSRAAQVAARCGLGLLTVGEDELDELGDITDVGSAIAVVVGSIDIDATVLTGQHILDKEGNITDVEDFVAVEVTGDEGGLGLVLLAEFALVGVGDIEVGQRTAAQGTADEGDNAEILGIPGGGNVNDKLVLIGIAIALEGNTSDAAGSEAQHIVVNIVVATARLSSNKAVLGDIDGELAVGTHLLVKVGDELAVNRDGSLAGGLVIGAVDKYRCMR